MGEALEGSVPIAQHVSRTAVRPVEFECNVRLAVPIKIAHGDRCGTNIVPEEYGNGGAKSSISRTRQNNEIAVVIVGVVRQSCSLPQVGDCDVGEAIGVEIADRDLTGVQAARAAIRHRCLEGSVAIANEHEYVSAAKHHQVRLSILIEIGGCQRCGIAHGDGHAGLKSLIAVAEKND
jgi:hypothetical protein